MYLLLTKLMFALTPVILFTYNQTIIFTFHLTLLQDVNDGKRAHGLGLQLEHVLRLCNMHAQLKLDSNNITRRS